MKFLQTTILVLLACLTSSELVTIDVALWYGRIDFSTISAAMENASAVLNSGNSCTVFLKAGIHSIDVPFSALFNVSLTAPVGGRLTIAGAGMLRTTLNISTHGNDVIKGIAGTGRLTFRDLTFARPADTTTQGRLVKVEDKFVILKIDNGFPAITSLLIDRIPRLRAEQGLYLKRYRRGFSDGPHIVVGDSKWPPVVNSQVHFDCGGNGATCPEMKLTGPGVWKLQVKNWGAGEMQRYKNDIGEKVNKTKS